MPHMTLHPPYHIRKLWPLDRVAFRRHLLRLDAETRLSRFGTAVNDNFLEAYADTAKRTGTLIYGAFIGKEMHGSAELRALHEAGDEMAEAAFAVEREHQHHGLGSALMDRIITAAQNRNIGQLHMICMRENQPMKRLATKFGARFRMEDGEATGEIQPAHATGLSLLDEAMHDETEFITAVLDWQSELPSLRKSA
jgi:GNAT superfamily N-acetyltransferase